jgi:DamX protein
MQEVYHHASINSQDANYMADLGLQKDPFSPEPDSLFYYSYDSFEQRLNVLHGLVQGADLFVLVIGERGSGKTTLLNRFLASSDTQWIAARIYTDPETAAIQSSDPQEHKGIPVYIWQDSADPVVIVDDSHQLLQKDLEFLIHEARVPGSSNKIKRLVLFGESDLYTAVTKIADSLSVEPAINKIHLPGMTEDETAEYLQHRLAIGGYSGEFPFKSSAINSIHQTSSGYPGSINAIAHQWLNDKYSKKEEGQNMLQKLAGSSRRKAAWIGAGIIIILLAALWLFSDRIFSKPKPRDQILAKTVVRKKIAPVRKSPPAPVRKKVAAAKTPVKPPAAIKTQQPPETKTTKAAPEPSAPIKTAPPSKEDPVASGSIITAPQKTESQPIMKPQPAAKSTPETDSQLKTALQPTPKPSPKTTSATVAQKNTREIRREKWILSQDAASYTIQIIGVSNEKSLLDFVKRNQLLKQNEIAYYKSTFRGHPWYQVLYGIYPTKQEAYRVANRLPENIRHAGPWIRRLSGVQQAIKKK